MRYLLSCLLFYLTACSKTDPAPALPPETTTGANTAGCKADDEILIPRSKWPTQGLQFGYTFLNAKQVSNLYFSFVDAQDREYPAVVINIQNISLEQGHTYRLGTHQGESQATFFLGSDYQTQDTNPGELTITRLDSAQHIIAGRFQFTGTQSATNQHIHVTDGRFDFRY